PWAKTSDGWRRSSGDSRPMICRLKRRWPSSRRGCGGSAQPVTGWRMPRPGSCRCSRTAPVAMASGWNRLMSEVPPLLDRVRRDIDQRLAAIATRLAQEIEGDVGRALAYALQSPGKRVRPALLVAAYQAVGG